jgi:hypothetical protein
MKHIFHKTEVEVDNIKFFARYDFRHYGGSLNGGFDTPGLLISLYDGSILEIDYGKGNWNERDWDYRYLEGAKGY